jgi:phage-related protein
MRNDSKVVDEGCDPALPSPPRVPPTCANSQREKTRLQKKLGAWRGGPAPHRHELTLAGAYLKNKIYVLVAWRVEILNETVAAEIAALPADMQARFLRLAERIASIGLESLSEPHVKHLEGKLWEMRLTGRDGIARALYVTAIGRRIVVVRAFVKKTQKTPRSEIELALRRAKEVA